MDYLRLLEHKTSVLKKERRLSSADKALRDSMHDILGCLNHFLPNRNDKYKNELHEMVNHFNSKNLILPKAYGIQTIAYCCYLKRDNYGTLNNSDQSFKLFTNLKYHLGRSISALQTANVYYQESEYPKALKDRRRAFIFLNYVMDLYEKNLITAGLAILKGRVEFQNASYNKALKYYREALELFKKLRYKKGEADVMTFVGRIDYQFKKYSEARKKFNYSIETYKRYGNADEEMAFAQLQLARTHYKEFYYRKALVLFDGCLNYFGGVGDKKRICQSLIQIGRIKYKTYDYDSGIKAYDKALEISRDINNKVEEAYSCLGLGAVNLFLHNFFKAEENLQLSKEIFTRINNKKGLSKVYFYLTILYFYLEEYNKADTYFEKSQELNKKSPFRTQRAATYHVLGLKSSSEGNVDEAISNILSCIKSTSAINHRIHNRQLGKAYLNLSLLYSFKGNIKNAIESLEKSLKIFGNYRYEKNFAKSLVAKPLINLAGMDGKSIVDQLIDAKKVCDRLPVNDCFISFLYGFIFLFPDKSHFLKLVSNLEKTFLKHYKDGAKLKDELKKDFESIKMEIGKYIAAKYDREIKAIELISEKKDILPKADELSKRIGKEIEKYRQLENYSIVDELYNTVMKIPMAIIARELSDITQSLMDIHSEALLFETEMRKLKEKRKEYEGSD